MRFNHMLDVAFTVDSEHEDWEQVPVDVLIKALEARIADLKAMPPEQALEAFGFGDTYEV